MTLICVLAIEPMLASAETLVRRSSSFGKFSPDLAGQFIQVEPRPLFRLENEFSFEDPNGLLWIVPKDEEVDGASIPALFWGFIGGPFSGSYLNASVIHDYYCRSKSRSERDTHRNFYYGMRAEGVSLWKAKFMYWAVEAFGPSWRLEQQVVALSSGCKTSEGAIAVCSHETQVMLVALVDQQVDLTGVTAFSAALAKAAAVARTLRTTDGESLDIRASGVVGASLDDIAENAALYTQLFRSETLVSNTTQLGVLSRWTADGLDSIEPWPGGVLPDIEAGSPLRQDAMSELVSGTHFRVEEGDDLELLRQLLDPQLVHYDTEVKLLHRASKGVSDEPHFQQDTPAVMTFESLPFSVGLPEVSSGGSEDAP